MLVNVRASHEKIKHNGCKISIILVDPGPPGGKQWHLSAPSRSRYGSGGVRHQGAGTGVVRRPLLRVYISRMILK